MTPSSDAAASRPRVLIVDDDLNILDFLSIALEDEGYAVETAENGAIALERLESRPPSAHPAIILLDLWMPVMDGLAFLRAYRERPAPHAAIIALTAAQYDSAQSTLVDADGFLTKPFSLDHLINLVDKLAQSRVAPSR